MVELGSRHNYNQISNIIQCDGSWDKTTGKTGIAWWLLKDNKSLYSSQHMLTRSALQSEALACLHALRWARYQHLHAIKVYSNSSTLLQLLQNRSPSNRHLLGNQRHSPDWSSIS